MLKDVKTSQFIDPSKIAIKEEEIVMAAKKKDEKKKGKK